MAEDVGSIHIGIDVDTTGLKVGRQSAKKELSGIEKEAERATKAFTRIGEAARGVGGILAGIGLGAGLNQSIQGLVNFQNEMSALRAVAGATEDQMAALEDQARSLGATTAFGANQAAQAQKFLAQAGLDVNEVLGAAPSVLQLAQAGMLDLGQAADLATDIMAQMGLEVGDLNRINDVLVRTAGSATTNVTQLGDAFSYAGPIANDFGLSLEQTSAALGIISSSGLKASRAGTGLLGTLRQLGNVTDDGQEILEAYGISIEQVDVSSRGIIPVLQTLADANLTASERIKLFGSEAAGAAAALINGIDAYRDQTEALGDVEGAAADAAKTLTDNLGGSLKGLQSAVSEANLQLGDSGLNGALNAVIVTATGIIQSFNGMTDEWAEANDVSSELVTTVEALDSAITILAAAAGGRAVQGLGAMAAAKVAANGAAFTLTGTLRALRTVMSTLFGPVGIAVGAAAILYEVHQALSDTSEQAARTETDIDDLTKSFKAHNAAAAEGALIELTANLFDLQMQASSAQKEIDRLSKSASLEDVMFAGRPGAASAELAAAEGELSNIQQRMSVIAGTADRIRKIRDSFRGDGAGGGAGGGAGNGGGRSGAGADEEDGGEDRAGTFAGGIGIFGDEEAGAFIQMLRDQLETRQEVLREYDALDAERQQEKFDADMERLREALELRAITEDEYRQAALERERAFAAEKFGIRQDSESGITGLVDDANSRQASAYASSFDSILGSLSTFSETAFKIQKGLALANATINAYEAITGAYKFGANIGGPPLGAAMAAAAGAAQFARIQQIRSQQFNSGGGSSGGGGAAGAGGGGGSAVAGGQAQQQQQTETLVANLSVQGEVFDRKTVIGLIDQINDLQQDGMRVVVRTD